VTGGAIAGGWWRGAWHGTPPGFSVVTLDDDRAACAYVGYDDDGQKVSVPSMKP
jgi:hypothetical protein